jgi:hypothetical protein
MGRERERKREWEGGKEGGGERERQRKEGGREGGKERGRDGGRDMRKGNAQTRARALADAAGYGAQRLARWIVSNTGDDAQGAEQTHSIQHAFDIEGVSAYDCRRR